MTIVEPATHDDIDKLVELEAGLFHVDAYIANQGAQRFYGRHGFEPQSVSRVLPL